MSSANAALSLDTNLEQELLSPVAAPSTWAKTRKLLDPFAHFLNVFFFLGQVGLGFYILVLYGQQLDKLLHSQYYQGHGTVESSNDVVRIVMDISGFNGTVHMQFLNGTHLDLLSMGETCYGREGSLSTAGERISTAWLSLSDDGEPQHVALLHAGWYRATAVIGYMITIFLMMISFVARRMWDLPTDEERAEMKMDEIKSLGAHLFMFVFTRLVLTIIPVFCLCLIVPLAALEFKGVCVSSLTGLPFPFQGLSDMTTYFSVFGFLLLVGLCTAVYNRTPEDPRIIGWYLGLQGVLGFIIMVFQDVHFLATTGAYFAAVWLSF